MAPVPGPSSRTGSPECGLMTLAILRAVIEEVGTMEPTVFGPCIIPLKKRISSSNFLPSRSFSAQRHAVLLCYATIQPGPSNCRPV